METDETLLDLGSVSQETANFLNVQSFDVLQLRLSTKNGATSGQPSELLSCIVQVVIRSGGDVETRKEPVTQQFTPQIGIHPFLYDFLSTSFHTVIAMEDKETPVDSSSASTVSDQNNATNESLLVTPLQMPGCDHPLLLVDDWIKPLHWTAKRMEDVRALPPGSSICLSLLYLDGELQQICEESQNVRETLQSTLYFFLEGRLLMSGTTTVLTSLEGIAVAAVNRIQEKDEDSECRDSVVYRLGNTADYNFHVTFNAPTYNDNSNYDTSALADVNASSAMVAWEANCPGYEKLVQSLVELTSLRGPAAPSGIILTGSPQVGKTHLVSCVAHRFTQTGATIDFPAVAVHWVSVQDLVLQATWADESDLIAMLRPPTRRKSPHGGFHQLLVIDDLHMFATGESVLQEDSVGRALDPEMLVVRNSVLQVIDEIVMQNDHVSGIAILAIAQSTNDLPVEFVRNGRLEKQVEMLPPTQSQRETILRNLFSTVIGYGIRNDSNKEQTVQQWAEALSSVTVGCVAGDLSRILASAWTRASARNNEIQDDATVRREVKWQDVLQAARTYVPIQLMDVDVCKPKFFWSDESTTINNGEMVVDRKDWAQIHGMSWKSFGGYPKLKKRILRTVVGPWRRFLASSDAEEDLHPSSSALGISPPPGVLFHGASGNGKSFAAICLGSSLGLPMIKVKAADVMDKWLGGSEAIIRSLFTRARSAAPCILFFDEIDAIATNRASGEEGGAEVMSRLLSTLLNEMDGISSDKRRQSVLVVACSNRLGDLDAALLRPGRLEEHVHLDYPDSSDIKDMLQIHLARVPLSNNVRLDDLGQELAVRKATGADVEGICHEACLEAVHRSTASDVLLTRGDIEKALRSSKTV